MESTAEFRNVACPEIRRKRVLSRTGPIFVQPWVRHRKSFEGRFRCVRNFTSSLRAFFQETFGNRCSNPHPSRTTPGEGFRKYRRHPGKPCAKSTLQKSAGSQVNSTEGHLEKSNHRFRSRGTGCDKRRVSEAWRQFHPYRFKRAGSWGSAYF